MAAVARSCGVVAIVLSLLLAPTWSLRVDAQAPAPTPQGEPYILYVFQPDLRNPAPGKPLRWRIQIRQRYSDGLEHIVTGSYETYWYVTDKLTKQLIERSIDTNEFIFTPTREGTFIVQVSLYRPNTTSAFRSEGVEITVRKQTPTAPAAGPNWLQDMSNSWWGFKITWDAATKNRMTPTAKTEAARREARTFCAKLVWNTSINFNLIIYYPGGSPRTERWPIHAPGLLTAYTADVGWYQDADPPRPQTTGHARLRLNPGRIEGPWTASNGAAGNWALYQTSTPISQPCSE